jgi:aspartyl/glutamyl-tRNA(Asn/Gln) amidotransferase C subunit
MTKVRAKKQEKGKITSEQIRQLGNLAKLSMTPTEEESIRKDLSSILDYFGTVDQVGEGVEIDRQVVGPEELRKDEVRPSDPEAVLPSVAHRKGRLVKAPRVF